MQFHLISAGFSTGDAPCPQAGSHLQCLFAFGQAFGQVKELYSELQSRMGQGPALGEQGRRVQNISQEAQALLQETMGIMLRMQSKALTNSIALWGRAWAALG